MTALAAIVVAGAFVSATQAVQLYGAYKPENKGSYVQGWAKIKTDCPYVACSVYVKIERSSWRGPQFVKGGFVDWSNQWVSMSATKLRGCYDYRTTVWIYTDAIGTVGGSVKIGKVGVTVSGQTIYKWKTGPWSSGWVRYCR